MNKYIYTDLQIAYNFIYATYDGAFVLDKLAFVPVITLLWGFRKLGLDKWENNVSMLKFSQKSLSFQIIFKWILSLIWRRT